MEMLKTILFSLFAVLCTSFIVVLFMGIFTKEHKDNYFIVAVMLNIPIQILNLIIQLLYGNL